MLADATFIVQDMHMLGIRSVAWSTLAFVLSSSAALAACSGGSTGTTITEPDGGGGGDAGPTPNGGDGGGTAEGGSGGPVCTSGKTWTRGNIGSELMRPGDTCISCHAGATGAPTFVIAGTVYPTLHEPLLCNGLAGVTVTITDAKGVDLTLTSNAAGNFACGPVARSGFPACNPTFPVSAHIKAPNGHTAAMIDPQMTGDCNSCHTEVGLNNAPGRISAQ
jgi:hypothetical protein